MSFDAEDGDAAERDSEPLAVKDAKHLWHPWSPIREDGSEPYRLIVSGSGCFITDDSGKRYFDARSSSFNAILGYGRSDVAEAIRHQMMRLMTYELCDASTVPPVELAYRIARRLPSPLGRCFFCCGGAEAVEASIKIVRGYQILQGRPGKMLVAGCAGSYHGPTPGALALSGSPFHQSGFGPLADGFLTVSYPAQTGGAPLSHDQLFARFCSELDHAGPERLAALVVEPILGNGGVRMIPGPVLRKIREFCSAHGILLIFDEILTGFGRTGEFFAFEHTGVVPDLLLLSKGLTAGYAPLSVVVARDDIHSVFARDPGLGGLRHGHTNSGHAASCAGALAVLDAIDREKLVENAAESGRFLLDGLRRASRSLSSIVDVRGFGLLLAIEFDEEGASAGAVVQRCAELGVLVRRLNRHVFIAPPLVISGGEAADLLESLSRALRECG